jgi:hypothetical protein
MKTNYIYTSFIFVLTFFYISFSQNLKAVDPYTVGKNTIEIGVYLIKAYKAIGGSDIEMGNVPTEVLNTHTWWRTLDSCDGWELQEHKITGHCRIIDDIDHRRAWGGREPMKRLFEQMKMEYEKAGGTFTGGKINSLKSDHPLSMPNKKMQVMNKHKCWNVLDSCNGWELQQNKYLRNCRIIDNQNYRWAWGGKKAMQKLFNQIKEESIQTEKVYGNKK